MLFPFVPLPDTAGEESSYACEREALSADEVAQVVALLDAERWRPAHAGEKVDATYRSAMVQWIHPHQARWLFERLASIVSELNGRWFEFDLAGFFDPLQATRYSAEDGGHYDWHTDRGTFASARPPRKLTVVVQLSNGTEYESGHTELFFGREPKRINRLRGSVHVFPSFVVHRVTPIVSGSRLALVGWVCGPRFR